MGEESSGQRPRGCGGRAPVDMGARGTSKIKAARPEACCLFAERRGSGICPVNMTARRQLQNKDEAAAAVSSVLEVPSGIEPL